MRKLTQYLILFVVWLIIHFTLKENNYLIIILVPIIFALFFIVLNMKNGFSLIGSYSGKKMRNLLEELLEKEKMQSHKKNLDFYIGYYYYMLGYNTNAEKYFRKALEKGFNKPSVYYMLSQIYVDEKKCDKAFFYINQAKEDKKIFNYLINLVYKEKEAWVNYICGDKEKAITQYKKIIPYYKRRLIKKGIELSLFFYHLGIISKHKGEYEKALEYFKKSIKAGGPESIFFKRSEEEIRKIVNGEL